MATRSPSSLPVLSHPQPYRVAGLLPNTRYSFKVRGYRDTCGTMVYTDYSNVLPIRTQP